MTAIVAREDGSDTIEIRSRIHPNQTWRFRCDLYINGKQWWMNYTEEKLQFFKSKYKNYQIYRYKKNKQNIIKDVAILMPYNDMFMSNLTLLFNSSGAGVQVSCSHGMIHLKYSAPPIMIVNNIHTFFV